MTSPRLTLRIPEVAARLGVPSPTVYQWVAAELLPAVRVVMPGRSKGVLLVRVEDLDNFLARNVTPGRM